VRFLLRDYNGFDSSAVCHASRQKLRGTDASGTQIAFDRIAMSGLTLLRLSYNRNMSQDRWPGQELAPETSLPQVEQPRMYQVILLNDHFTPMNFVVEVLEKFFHMERPQATQVMLHVHTRGRAICGVFSYEIAETKVMQIRDYARQHEHPLMCTLEAI
jgi:ATP-dependent Clp protease adaptor protein ClpS